MIRFVAVLVLCFLTGVHALPARAADRVFQINFDTSEVGKVPEDFLVLDGGFAVQADGANRFLELPGAPLESFGVLFGPTEKDGVRVGARILATSKGRRFPVIGVGLNGAVPFRLQISPAKKALELYKGDEMLASVPFTWESGSWTEFRLQLAKSGDSGWTLQGKAWKQGAPEPAAWSLTHPVKEEPVPGRASIWGKPFSETPIRFDDLFVEKAS